MRSKILQKILDETPEHVKLTAAAYARLITSDEWTADKDKSKVFEYPVGLEEYLKIKEDANHPLHPYLKQ